MKAVDTNILVRLISRDDPAQVIVAENVIGSGAVMILPTVVLECVWVLRSRYNLPREQIADELSAICGLPGIHVVSEPSVAYALARYAEAGDFADLLHLALAAQENAGAFVTFDREIVGDDGIAVELV